MSSFNAPGTDAVNVKFVSTPTYTASTANTLLMYNTNGNDSPQTLSLTASTPGQLPATAQAFLVSQVKDSATNLIRRTFTVPSMAFTSGASTASIFPLPATYVISTAYAPSICSYGNALGTVTGFYATVATGTPNTITLNYPATQTGSTASFNITALFTA